jgi:hypothetical protein
MRPALVCLPAACNDPFTTLQLPAAIRIDPGRGMLVLPRYDGDDLAARWSETDGGARLAVTLAGTIAAVLADLAGIDTTPVTGDPVLSAIGGLVFDHAAALTRSAGITRQLSRAGLLSGEDCARAEQLMGYRQHTPMIVNNGDFYPRNLVVRPDGRIVIVDWETWNPGSPFHTIDHPENVAAVFYVHMWGNPAWQAACRAALHARFAFSPASFAKGVVIAALELARMWLNGTDRHLAAIQASVITSTLAQTPDQFGPHRTIWYLCLPCRRPGCSRPARAGRDAPRSRRTSRRRPWLSVTGRRTLARRPGPRRHACASSPRSVQDAGRPAHRGRRWPAGNDDQVIPSFAVSRTDRSARRSPAAPASLRGDVNVFSASA